MRRVHILALAIFVTARNGESQSAQPARAVVTTVRDTIVARLTGEVPSNKLRRLALEWRARDDPTIGDISGMAVAPSGAVWVWDHATPALWLVSADGASIKRVGRVGSGPGEYTRVYGIAARSDGSLVMWDDGNSRVNVYDADGTYRSSWLVPIRGVFPNNAVTTDSRDRVWLLVMLLAAPEKSALATAPPSMTRAYVRVDKAGAVLDTIVAPVLPGTDRPLVAQRPDGGQGNLDAGFVPRGTSMMMPFGVANVATVSPLGHVVVGQTRGYVVHSTLNARPVRIEGRAAPVPLSTEERAHHRASVEFSLRRMQPNWSWDGRDIPSHKPPYFALAAGLDGRIWVSLSVPSERYEPDPPPATQQHPPPPIKYRPREQRWDVFEPDGRYVGRVVAPRQFGAFVMRGDFVWGVLRDEDDVPSIVKMRISL